MTESDILVEDCTEAGHDQPRVSPAAWHTRLVSGWLRWRRRNHGQTTAPLPATAPIHELGNDANAQPVPRLLRISERSEKGIGSIFVGREDVLQDVDTFLEQKRTANSAFAILLTNAPGSGKSTILDELRFRRAHAGQPVIQLTASAFLSDQNFLDELRSTDLWQRSLPEEATLWAAARGTGVLGRLGETALRLLAVLHRVPVAPIARFRHWYEAAERLHASLAKDPPSTVDDALRAIDEACHRGWIIAVDECGHWDRLRHCADQAAKITELLYKVADTTKRRGGRLKHGGLLLTGLSDAQQATMALTLSRAKIMQLAPLTMTEAAALIRATLDRSGAPVAITERWTATLARDFSMWTQHAQRAASVAAEMIERTYRLRLPSVTREGTWDHRLALVRQQTAAQIMGVYATIAGRAVLLIGPRAVRQLATAHQRTDGRIPDAECRAIIQAGRDRAKRQKPRTIGEDGALRDLMSIGLLHLDMSLGPSHDEITWSIAMGSLTGHILAGVKDNEPPDEPATEAVPAPSQQPGPTTTTAITPPEPSPAQEPPRLNADAESNPKVEN